jgi:hypothetical protein
MRADLSLRLAHLGNHDQQQRVFVQEDEAVLSSVEGSACEAKRAKRESVESGGTAMVGTGAMDGRRKEESDGT